MMDFVSHSKMRGVVWPLSGCSSLFRHQPTFSQYYEVCYGMRYCRVLRSAKSGFQTHLFELVVRMGISTAYEYIYMYVYINKYMYSCMCVCMNRERQGESTLVNCASVPRRGAYGTPSMCLHALHLTTNTVPRVAIGSQDEAYRRTPGRCVSEFASQTWYVPGWQSRELTIEFGSQGISFGPWLALSIETTLPLCLSFERSFPCRVQGDEILHRAQCA